MASNVVSFEARDRSADAFFDDLRAYESGIHVDRHDWYVAKFDAPVIEYPEVARPGRVIRDPATGRHRLVERTVAGYFEALGVGHLFDPADPQSLRAMQYQSMNAWGYVGYQFGEECLVAAGYYEFEKVRIEDGDEVEFTRYHRGGIDPTAWSNGRTEIVLKQERVILTDVNRWRGRFTGKHGVSSFADLLRPESQEAIIREVASSNVREVTAILDERSPGVGDVLALQWRREGRTVECSLSGIIACCHLLGPRATADFLLSSSLARDEFGTSALDYMQRFGEYSVDQLVNGEPGT